MKILLPVDGSLYTKKMLAYLATHLNMFAKGNEFTVLSVQPTLPPRARGMLGPQELVNHYKEEAAKVLDPVLKFLEQHGIPATARAETGSPGDVIAQYATDGRFELIIMGSHGNSALAGLVMGSVASKVLAACVAPVLLIR